MSFLKKIFKRKIIIHTTVSYTSPAARIVHGKNLMLGDKVIYAQSTHTLEIDLRQRQPFEFDIEVDTLDPIGDVD